MRIFFLSLLASILVVLLATPSPVSAESSFWYPDIGAAWTTSAGGGAFGPTFDVNAKIYSGVFGYRQEAKVQIQERVIRMRPRTEVGPLRKATWQTIAPFSALKRKVKPGEPVAATIYWCGRNKPDAKKRSCLKKVVVLYAPK